MNNSTDMPISVVIPTHNRSKCIARAVDSVFAQTYGNYEIIIVDDGSMDDTRDVLQEKYGDRIRYMYQPNKGPAAARNRGIQEARYELIAFLDSDDSWLPRKLERQVPLMSDRSIVLSYTNWIDNRRNERKDHFSVIGMQVDRKPVIYECPMEILVRRNGSGICTPTIICRKEAVQHVGGFDERMRFAEDIRLWFRLALEGNFTVLSEPLSVIERAGPEEQQLTKTHDPVYFKESANLRLEVFLESYARALNSLPAVQKRLRSFIADCFAEQAKYAALDGKYATARRRAFESLAFRPKGKTALKAVIGLAFPKLYHVLPKSG